MKRRTCNGHGRSLERRKHGYRYHFKNGTMLEALLYCYLPSLTNEGRTMSCRARALSHNVNSFITGRRGGAGVDRKNRRPMNCEASSFQTMHPNTVHMDPVPNACSTSRCHALRATSTHKSPALDSRIAVITAG